MVDRVVVVTPTEHLKSQWAQAADLMDIAIDPAFGRGVGLAPDYDGVAVTYAGVAAATAALRAMVTSRRTLVILDEIHHAGDAMSWGEAVQEAFTPATARLSRPEPVQKRRQPDSVCDLPSRRRRSAAQRGRLLPTATGLLWPMAPFDRSSSWPRGPDDLANPVRGRSDRRPGQRAGT